MSDVPPSLLRELEARVAQDPDDVRAHLALGDTRARRGDGDGALCAYHEALRVYEGQGFFLKSIAVLKQMARVRESAELAFDLATFYALLGLRDDHVSTLRRHAATLDARGARAVLDFVASDVERDWLEGVAAVGDVDNCFVWLGHAPTSLVHVPVGHRASALVVARREAERGGRVELRLPQHASESRPVRSGPFVWVSTQAGPTRVVGDACVVPVGGGRWEPVADPIVALRALLADAMPSELHATRVVRVLSALGADVFAQPEPPHFEGRALVVHTRKGRVRIDADSLAVELG